MSKKIYIRAVLFDPRRKAVCTIVDNKVCPGRLTMRFPGIEYSEGEGMPSPRDALKAALSQQIGTEVGDAPTSFVYSREYQDGDCTIEVAYFKILATDFVPFLKDENILSVGWFTYSDIDRYINTDMWKTAIGFVEVASAVLNPPDIAPPITTEETELNKRVMLPYTR